jgi:hypothetical protein
MFKNISSLTKLPPPKARPLWAASRFDKPGSDAKLLMNTLSQAGMPATLPGTSFLKTISGASNKQSAESYLHPWKVCSSKTSKFGNGLVREPAEAKTQRRSSLFSV